MLALHLLCVSRHHARRCLLAVVNNAEDVGNPGLDATYGFGKLRPFRACSTGFAQRGAISGAVTEGGQPVEGVRVSTDSTQTVTSDATGHYVCFA